MPVIDRLVKKLDLDPRESEDIEAAVREAVNVEGYLYIEVRKREGVSELSPELELLLTRLALTDDQKWLLYDLVTGRVQDIEKAELATQANCGGEPWRLLQRKLRYALPPVEEPT